MNPSTRAWVAAAGLLLAALVMFAVRSPGLPGAVQRSVVGTGAPSAPVPQDAPLRALATQAAEKRVQVPAPGVDAVGTASPANHLEFVSVFGQVLDGLGRPAEGVSVTLRVSFRPNDEELAARFRNAFGKRGSWHSATTNEQGRYVFEDVPARRYSFDVKGTSVAPRRLLIDADLEQDFRLPGTLVLAGRVLGVYRGQATVELRRADFMFGGELEYDMDPKRMLQCGANGEFRASGLTPGFYSVDVKGDGLATTSQELELRCSIRDLEIRCNRGLTMAGVLSYDAGEGERTFSMYPWKRPVGEWVEHDGVKSDGSFELTGLSPGTYELDVAAYDASDDSPLKRTYEVELVEDRLDLNIAVTAEKATLALVVDLPQGSQSVRGEITARQGLERRKRRVEFLPSAKGTSYRIGGSGALGPSWTDTPELTLDLAPGDWEISIWARGFATWSRTVKVTDGELERASLVPLSGRNVTAKVGATFYRVEGRPALSTEEWRLLLWSDGRVRASHTPTPGVYSAWLEPGTYDFRITTNEHIEVLVPGVQIDSSLESLLLEPELRQGLTISGELHGGGSTWLYLDRKVGAQWVRLPTKVHDGGVTFAFAGLTPGRFRASADFARNLVVKEWLLTDHDLTEEVVTFEPK